MAEDFFKRFEELMQSRYPTALSAPESGDGSADHSPGIPKWVWLGIAAVIAVAYFAMRK